MKIASYNINGINGRSPGLLPPAFCAGKDHRHAH